jgi:Leucine-rich repeat (LRR) protein
LFIALCQLLFQAQGFDLECEFHENSFWFYIGSAEECSVKNLVVLSKNQIVTLINGENSYEFENDDRKMLNIQSQIVNFMPEELEHFFPDLEGIRIAHSGLKIIEKSDIQAFENLKHLYLNDNDLESLEDSLFESNPALKVIDFTNNKLKVVGENILQPLINLEVAHFQNNICIDIVASTWNSKISRLISELKEKCAAPELELEKALAEIAKLKTKLNVVEAKLQTCNKKPNKPKNNKN